MESDIVNLSESLKVSRLIASGIINSNNILKELGIMMFHEYGHYGIMDHKRWFLAKIKYGF